MRVNIDATLVAIFRIQKTIIDHYLNKVTWYIGHIMLLLKCKCSQNQLFYQYFSILSPWQRLTYQKSANIRFSYSSKKVVPSIYISIAYISSVKLLKSCLKLSQFSELIKTSAFVMPPFKKEGILLCTCRSVGRLVGRSVCRYVGIP